MALKLPDWGLKFLLAIRIRFKIIRGGRGSAKSHTVARCLLVRAMEQKTRVLCAREFQNSIKESVHQLLSDIINDPENGFLGYFEILETEIRHIDNGSEFFFKGLARQINSIKSIEGIDIAWIEEAQTVSQKSLDILIPTVRKEGSELWFTYNPDLDSDPVHILANSKRDDLKTIDVNWNNNPFISQVLIDEKDAAYASNPSKAENIWGGKTRKNSEQHVFKNWKIIAFEPDESFGPAYQGLDFGFSQDPMAFVRMYVHSEHKRIYFRYAIAKKGILPNSMAPFLEMVPDVKKYNTIADSARPELVAHLKADGFKIESAQKWPGSVEDGVQWMQDYELIVHPDCLKASYATEDEKYTIDHEFNNYSFKVDKRTGLITSDLEDKDNHYTDAGRYGLQRFIKKKKSVFDNL